MADTTGTAISAVAITGLVDGSSGRRRQRSLSTLWESPMASGIGLVGSELELPEVAIGIRRLLQSLGVIATVQITFPNYDAAVAGLRSVLTSGMQYAIEHCCCCCRWGRTTHFFP